MRTAALIVLVVTVNLMLLYRRWMARKRREIQEASRALIAQEIAAHGGEDAWRKATEADARRALGRPPAEADDGKLPF
jgi:hypothetical protein